jgi:hypothetical protein
MDVFRDIPRNYTSHFGPRRTIHGEFRYNVLHIGGYVTDDLWKDVHVTPEWGVWTSSVNGLGNYPYGWPWKNGSGSDAGIVDEPDFEGAYDRD